MAKVKPTAAKKPAVKKKKPGKGKGRLAAIAPPFIRVILPANTAVDPTAVKVIFRGPVGSTVDIFFSDAAALGLPMAIPAPLGGWVSPASLNGATPTIGHFYVADGVLTLPGGATISDTAITQRS